MAIEPTTHSDLQAIPFQVKDWKAAASAKKLKQQSLIPVEWIIPASLLPPDSKTNVQDVVKNCGGILSEKELEITEIDDVGTLVGKMKVGEYTAVEVTTAYCKRAAIAQQVVNCLTEIFFDQALANAAELDAHFIATGELKGPFHGVPVSLKDMALVKGIETTNGYVSWIGNVATENADLVDCLLNAGAVMYCKTQIPLSLMIADSKNNIYGRALNPFNRTLTPGGSSGGEGALIGFKGSIIGVGTDIAGSIRIPATCQGLYGLKVSNARLPYTGLIHSGGGNEGIAASCGPLGRSVDSLELFMKSILDQEPWSICPAVTPMPWRPSEVPKDLTFAVIYDDGIATPHPPIQRALKETVTKLRAAGYEVVELDVGTLHIEALVAAVPIYSQDGGLPFLEAVEASGEPVYPEISNGLIGGKVVSSTEVFESVVKRNAFRRKYAAFLLDQAKTTKSGRIDAVISPVASHVAPPHDTWRGASYTAIWNLLDSAAGVVPIGVVDPVLDAVTEEWTNYVPLQSGLGPIDETSKAMYTGPEKFKDAPICLQVLSGRLKEETCLAAIRVISQLK